MEIPIEDGSEENEGATAASNGDGAASVEAVEAPMDPIEQAKVRERELVDQLQRLAAEFDNYRKKNAGEYSRGVQDGQARAIEAILPALDSFTLAVASAANATDVGALRSGVEAVQRQLLGLLGGLGLEEIHAAPGDTLDPNVHEVLMAQPGTGIEPGRVTAEFQVGYRFKSRLLRAAKVCVAAEPPASESAGCGTMTEKTDGDA
ncbi:MAG: nucleotide exchange factor GrpE [Deltaproteobacteria bacterium]|nr:nucleotide exchange factor GrpE [Deltaproteobacteria bacterium]